MKPPPFAYEAPRSIDEAIALLGAHGDEAKVLAGGQSLIPLLALRLARPSVLVDLGHIDELRTLSADDGVRISANVTQRRIERSAEVAHAAPLLAEAARWVAHPQIRNRATVCGSVAHADPAAEMPAIMLTLDATMHLAGPNGVRSVAAEDFFESYLETTIEHDEILLEICVPKRPTTEGWGFAEISRRHGDFAVVGSAAVIDLDDEARVRNARLAFFGVAGTPMRAHDAEALLIGHTLTADLAKAAAEMAQRDLAPSTDVHATGAYRRHVAGVLAQRVLNDAARRAQRAQPSAPSAPTGAPQ